MNIAVSEPGTAAPVGEKSDRELAREELTIAREYIGPFPVFMAIWGLGNLVCWLALWPLVMTGTLSLWIAFPLATLNVVLCYLPSHEAQHSNYAKSGEPLRCVCGTLCGLPRCWVDTTPPEYPLERYATACGLVQRLP